jgi:hypothetical protein
MPAVAFVSGQSAPRFHTSLRQSLNAIESAQQCAVLWFAEIMCRHPVGQRVEPVQHHRRQRPRPRVADFTVYDPLSPVPQVPSGRGARLLPNVPNPFNHSTVVRFELDQAGTVKLNVYDARGRLVRVLAAGTHGAGSHGVTWDGTDRAGRQVASGVYQVRLVSRVNGMEVTSSRPITLVE